MPFSDVLSIFEKARILPKTDREILGDIVRDHDEGADWLIANDYYRYYYAIGERLKPRRIGEIGVRLGYSLKAMIDGAIAGGVPKEDIVAHAYDNESYVSGSLDYCRGYFLDKMGIGGFGVHRMDTLEFPNLDEEEFDLFHVDGGHTRVEAYHDMNLAMYALQAGGVMLVDDVTYSKDTVGVSAMRFCGENKLTPLLIPHLRGLFYIEIPE